MGCFRCIKLIKYFIMAYPHQQNAILAIELTEAGKSAVSVYRIHA